MDKLYALVNQLAQIRHRQRSGELGSRAEANNNAVMVESFWAVFDGYELIYIYKSERVILISKIIKRQSEDFSFLKFLTTEKYFNDNHRQCFEKHITCSP